MQESLLGQIAGSKTRQPKTATCRTRGRRIHHSYECTGEWGILLPWPRRGNIQDKRGLGYSTGSGMKVWKVTAELLKQICIWTLKKLKSQRSISNHKGKKGCTCSGTLRLPQMDTLPSFHILFRPGHNLLDGSTHCLCLLVCWFTFSHPQKHPELLILLASLLPVKLLYHNQWLYKDTGRHGK